MAGICTIRILYARFLALYRWNIVNQSRSVSSRELSKQLAANRHIFTTLQTFTKHFSQMKIPEFHVRQNFGNNSLLLNDKEVKFKNQMRFLDAAVQIVNTSVCYYSTLMSFSNRVLTIIVPNKYSFSLVVCANGKVRLKSFRVLWPNEVVTESSFFQSKLIPFLSSTVKYSKHPIDDCCYVLNKVYQKGVFSKVCSILESLQSKNSYVLSFNDDKAVLTFPYTFAPSNAFTIYLDDNRIILVSNTPMISDNAENEDHKQFLSYTITPDIDQIQSIISEICIAIFYTRLAKLWSLIKQSISTISMHQFKGVFQKKLKCIEIYLFDIIIMRIDINPFSGDIVVHSFNGIGMDPHEFIHSIEGCECQRNEAIRIVFLHSLSYLLYEDNLDPRVQFKLTNSENRRDLCTLYLSYADSCKVTFGEEYGTTSISIKSSDGSTVSTPEIMVSKISNEEDLKFKSIEAARSSKIAILLLQLVKTLKDHGTIARLENDRVHFVTEPFECVEFQISQYMNWSLQFIKPSNEMNDILTLTFTGTSINARFVDWIIYLVKNVSTFMQILKQTYGVYSMDAIIKNLDIPNKTQFSLKMIHDYCSTLSVSLSPVKLVQSSPGNEIYECNSCFIPHIMFQFSRYVPLKQHLENILRSGTISFLFGSFLNSSYAPLQHFSEIFKDNEYNADCHDQKKSNWTISALRDDGSFFLIFQKEMSINFMLRSAQMFQLIIPSAGKCKILQIPLESLPKFCHIAKLSHPTMKLHMSQLTDFKEAIERFFYFRELLGKIGFENFRVNGSEVYSPFPVTCPYLNISCHIRPTKIEFDAESPQGDQELVQCIKTVMNYQFDEVDIQILMIRFVINILSFPKNFVEFIIQFVAKMIEKTVDLGLDWKQILDLTAVSPLKSKIIFHFATTHGAFFVEMTNSEGESHPLIVGTDKVGVETKIKSFKELIRWVGLFETSDTE